MKSRIIFIALICFGFIFTPALKAQWTVGAEGGLQLNNVRVTGIGALLNGIPKTIITPYGRLTANYQASEKLALRGGVGYSRKGFQLAGGLNVNIFKVPIGIGAKVATIAEYAEVPLEAAYSLKKGNTTLLLTGGANIGYALGAVVQPKVSVIIDFNLPKTDLNLEDDIYNRWDISATAGIGIVHEKENGNLILQARYVQSLSNFLDNPIVGMKLKPYSIQFGVGYQMFLGRKYSV